MLHDTGVAEFWRVVQDETQPPVLTPELEPITSALFGDMTVGVTRYYSAAAANRTVSRLIEIWYDPAIEERMLCSITSDQAGLARWYEVDKVEHSTDTDGLRVTRVTLTETDGSVWEARVHG